MISPSILQTFIAVLDGGSIVAASRACGYTPAAVSRQMSSLQKRLGVRLFEPDGRGIRPTPIAVELAIGARRLLEQNTEFAAFARDVCRVTGSRALV